MSDNVYSVNPAYTPTFDIEIAGGPINHTVI